MLAALVTAVVGLYGAGSPEPSPAPVVDPHVAITTWSQESEHGGSTYEFEGTVSHAPEHSSVRVIVRDPHPSEASGQGMETAGKWLVSPQADLLENGHWKVRWPDVTPPRSARFTAVLIDLDAGCSDSEGSCAAPTERYLRLDGVHGFGVVASRPANMQRSN
ncbi:hypothetical protein [Streptomyces sp. BH055]|uniref:hypothetical protein n=1 Tax=Streptomyces sp. BH055 TaxID=3401173 RepID=UPI003BB68F11